MAISATCPHCAHRLTLSSRQAGVRVLCPRCGGPLTAPSGVAGICARPARPTRQAVPRAVGVCPPANLRLAAKRRPINHRRVATISGVSLLLCAGLVAGGVMLVQRSRHAAEEPVAVVTPVVQSEPEPVFPPEVPIHAPAEPPSHFAALPSPPAPPIEVKQPPSLQDVRKHQRTKLGDEDLRKQLVALPEMRIDKGVSRRTAQALLMQAQENATKTDLRPNQVHFTPDLLDARADLGGLPWRRGADCQLGNEPAAALQRFSRTLRRVLLDPKNQNDPDQRTAAVRSCISELTRFHVTGGGRSIDLAEAALPTLMQMLCAEIKPVRLVLIEQLEQMSHRSAGEALAKLAVFDLSETIRAEAIRALSKRPPAEFRDVLLNALRYPWAPAADHAATALVVLEDRGAVPALKTLVEQPDPQAPYYDWMQRTYRIREVVRVSHLANCMMCHAPSTAPTDLVRGRVPTPGEALPVEYYENPNGIFVRADVTYLRQDFSVVQPVDSPNSWPTMQRFDYIVRQRPVQLDELNRLRRDPSAGYPQRDAVRYALMELESDSKQLRREEVSFSEKP